MAIKSTKTRYGAVAITIHWVTALAILGMLISGTVAVNTLDDATKTNILRVHAIMGVTILALTLLRIVWWWLIDRKPEDVAGMSALQARAAHWVHITLYGVILLMASSGLALLVLSGANLQIFGSAPPPLPNFDAFPPRSVHWLMSRLLLVLLVGHIGAALYHQFARRDHLLARMGIGR